MDVRREKIHELTSEGILAARDYLAALRDGRQIPFPEALLTNSQYAIPVEPTIILEQRSFENRRDAALYLTRRLDSIGPQRVMRNAYLWSWLGMFFFEKVVRKDIYGNFLIGRNPDSAYIIDPESQGGEWSGKRQYAHRLMMCYEIWKQHGLDAWYLLDEPVNSLSQFTLRLVSGERIFRATGIVPLAILLYVDPVNRKLRNGSLGTDRASAPPGSLPRLLEVLEQLSMTFDVYGMKAERLLQLLPPEFDRFAYSDMGTESQPQ